MVKANMSLYVRRVLVNPKLINFSRVLHYNFIYGISVYGASDSDLTAIQKFLDRFYKTIKRHIIGKIDVHFDILFDIDI